MGVYTVCLGTAPRHERHHDRLTSSQIELVHVLSCAERSDTLGRAISFVTLLGP